MRSGRLLRTPSSFNASTASLLSAALRHTDDDPPSPSVAATARLRRQSHLAPSPSGERERAATIV